MALARVKREWFDQVVDRSKQTQWIYDIVFSPDGSSILVAAGNLILVYDTSEGTMIDMLKGHRDTVYCLSYEWTGIDTRVCQPAGEISPEKESSIQAFSVKYAVDQYLAVKNMHPLNIMKQKRERKREKALKGRVT